MTPLGYRKSGASLVDAEIAISEPLVLRTIALRAVVPLVSMKTRIEEARLRPLI
jgi:hypothetical protein